jgi:hypothetical protein
LEAYVAGSALTKENPMPSRSTAGRTQSARKPLTLEAEAQQVLKELWDEQLIPFVLNVGKIVKEVSGEYTIHFHDSRIHSARFS